MQRRLIYKKKKLFGKLLSKEVDKDKNFKGGKDMIESDLIKIKRAYSKVLISGTTEIDWKTAPISQDSPGNDGDIARDDKFIYIYIDILHRFV